jgi:pimeloyl-ACP methyl ester carboxylesterase
MTRTDSEAPNPADQRRHRRHLRLSRNGHRTDPVGLAAAHPGNLDNWDSLYIDRLAVARRIITFDNAGVGGSSAATPPTIEQLAHDALAYVTAMGLEHVDILGYSIGSFVAQEMAPIPPDVLHKLVLASSAPKGTAGMHGWAPEVIDAVGKARSDSDGCLRVF